MSKYIIAKKGDIILRKDAVEEEVTKEDIIKGHSGMQISQESLTKQIHDEIDSLCIGNRGVAVVIESQHCCVKCRQLNQDSVMKTSQLSGYFHTNEIGTRQEFFNLIDQSRY